MIELRSADWDRTAVAYDRVSRFSRAHQDKFERVSRLLLDSGAETILDLGCGSGILEDYLVRHGYRGRVTALDGSTEMLSLARDAVRDPGFTFEWADLDESLALLDEGYDAVVSVNVMFCLADAAAFCREVNRVLRSGGIFLLVMPKPEAGGVGPFVKQQLAGKGCVDAARELAAALKHLPAIIKAARFQNTLDRRHQDEGRVFMSQEQVADALAAADLVFEEVEEIQASQNWLFRCVKADSRVPVRF